VTHFRRSPSNPDDKTPHYEVKLSLSPESSTLGDALVPGMPAEVFIIPDRARCWNTFAADATHSIDVRENKSCRIITNMLETEAVLKSALKALR
jgi:hypothetical protein